MRKIPRDQSLVPISHYQQNLLPVEYIETVEAEEIPFEDKEIDHRNDATCYVTGFDFGYLGIGTVEINIHPRYALII